MPCRVDGPAGVKYCQGMETGAEPFRNDEHVERSLAEVRRLMLDALTRSTLGPILGENPNVLANGKMLRSRLAFRVGPEAGVPHSTLLHTAAAVELIHAASLLHDDVIDGGFLRRGAPAFWVERGVPGAILLGDLLLFKALDLMTELREARFIPMVVKLTGEVCEAESEQELLMRGRPSDWDSCVSIARRKTGALFAFLGYVCGGDDTALSVALRDAGYAVGTAYQLADDILDANGNSESAGKTLGSDEARSKTTAARVLPPDRPDPASFVEELCHSARKQLDRWPAIQRAWDAYMARDLRPVLDMNLRPVRA